MKRRSKRTRTWPLGCVAVVAVILMAGPALGADEGSAGTPLPPEAPVPTSSQREAAKVLQSMARHLAGLQSFTVDFRAGYDVVQATGQKIEFGESRVVTMVRPDRLRVEEVSSDGTRDLALFDGKTVTVMNADANAYAQAPQPQPVDDALVYFVRDLRMRMPLALLLTTRLPDELSQRVKSIDLVEREDIDGVPVHHLAGRTDAVDFQFWVTEGDHPLPLRIVLTYRDAEGQPQYWANFTHWNTSPTIADGTFRFLRPAGARQIPFAVQRNQPSAPVKATGGTAP